MKLMLYSEWLDVQGLMTPPAEDDARTHEILAKEYLKGKK